MRCGCVLRGIGGCCFVFFCCLYCFGGQDSAHERGRPGMCVYYHLTPSKHLLCFFFRHKGRKKRVNGNRHVALWLMIRRGWEERGKGGTKTDDDGGAGRGRTREGEKKGDVCTIGKYHTQVMIFRIDPIMPTAGLRNTVLQAVTSPSLEAPRSGCLSAVSVSGQSRAQR